MRRRLVLALYLGLTSPAWAQDSGLEPFDPDFDESEFEGPDDDPYRVPVVDEADGLPTVDEDDAFPSESDTTDPTSRTDVDRKDELDVDDELQPEDTLGVGSLSPRARAPTTVAGSGEAIPPPPAAPGPPGSELEIVTEVAIRDALERRSLALMTADTASADLALAELVEAKRTLGLRNVPVAAALLIHEAEIAKSAGRTDEAVDLAEAATTLAPDLPAAHWMYALTVFDQDATQVVELSTALVSTLRSWIVPFRNAVTLWTWVIAAVGAAVLFVIVGYTAAQLMKYLRYPAYDLSVRLPGVFGSGEFWLLLLLVVLCPLAVGYGLVTSTAIGLGFVFAYQTVKERILSTAFLVALAVLPFLLDQSAPLILFHGSDTDVLAAAYAENIDRRVEARLQGLASSQTGQQLAFARISAHRARQRGDLEQARRWYEIVVQSDGMDPGGLNNLAILQYLDGDQELAKEGFRRATASARPEPRLNLSLVLADEGQFSEADAMLVQARNMNPDLAEAFTALDGARPAAQRFLEVPLPDTFLWSRMFEVDPAERSAVVRELWQPIGGRTPPDVFWGIVVGAALLAGLAVRRRRVLSIPCSKCGRPADVSGQATLCAQCISVFVTAVAVEPAVRQQKEVEVRRHQRRRRSFERAFGFLGLGLTFGDRPFQGIVIALTVAGAASAAYLLPLLRVSSWNVYTGEAGRLVLLSGLGLVGALAAIVGLQRGWGR